MELAIKKRIFCDTVEAIREARRIVTIPTRTGTQPALPETFGVQIQLSVTVNEQAALTRFIHEQLASGLMGGDQRVDLA